MPRRWRIAAALLGVTAGLAGAHAAPVGAVSATKTVVICPDRAGDSVGRVKPRTCSFHVNTDFGARAASADWVDVTRMRWRHWGRRTTTARGTYVGNMDVRWRGVVILSRRKRCSDGALLYTHFRMTRHGREVFEFDLDSCV